MIDSGWSLKKMIVGLMLSLVIICVVIVDYFIFINYELNPKQHGLSSSVFQLL